MAKTLAIIFGIIFVLLGLLGFVDNSFVGANAMFAADTLHNIVRIVLGAILLGVALWSPMASAKWLKIMGIVAIVISLVGFVTAGSGMWLGLFAENGADNWLYLIIGIVLLASGMWGRENRMSPAPSMSSPMGGDTMGSSRPM